MECEEELIRNSDAANNGNVERALRFPTTVTEEHSKAVSRHEHKGHGSHPHNHRHGDRHGARQPERFDPARAALLDDPARLEYLPPERLIELLDAPPSARVVDFGAGTGAIAIELARRRPDLEVIALDEQPQMLDLLKAKPAARELRNLKAVLSGEMPLANSVERVLAIDVLHELGDAALEDLAGILKPGGLALVVDWNSETDRPVGPPRDHVYSLAEARHRLEAVGLRVNERQPLKYHYVFVAAKPSK
jgi:SAM-dependent methyltransferase